MAVADTCHWLLLAALAAESLPAPVSLLLAAALQLAESLLLADSLQLAESLLLADSLLAEALLLPGLLLMLAEALSWALEVPE